MGYGNIGETPGKLMWVSKVEIIYSLQIMDLFHVKDSKAYGLLKKLADTGYVIPVNKGRYAKIKSNDKSMII